MVVKTERSWKNGGDFWTVNGTYHYSSKIQAWLKYYHLELVGPEGFTHLGELSDDDYTALIHSVVESSGESFERVDNAAKYWW